MDSDQTSSTAVEQVSPAAPACLGLLVAIAALIPISAVVAFLGQAVAFVFGLPCHWEFAAQTPKPVLLAGILIGFPALWIGGGASGYVGQMLSGSERSRPLWICMAAMLFDVVFVIALYSLTR
jgi:hypothetical protein